MECLGRDKGVGESMEGQSTEVACLTFTHPFFIPSHRRARMTLKYSIDCESSCACEKAWHKETLLTKHDILLLSIQDSRVVHYIG